MAHKDELNDDLSTEAWMLLNLWEHEWFVALTAQLLNLREEEVSSAAKELNALAGRKR